MLTPLQDATVNLALVAGAIVVSLMVLVVLHASPPYIRRWVIVVVTFLAGLYVPLEFFIPRHNFLTVWRDPIGDLVRVLAGFTIGLGILNLLIVHGRHLLQRTANFPFSPRLLCRLFEHDRCGVSASLQARPLGEKSGSGPIAFLDGGS